MNSATIFAIITAVGLLSCGLQERLDLLILPIITTLSFLATIFSSVKPKTQLFILTRISQLPLPRWMTPLKWLSLSIALILLANLLGNVFAAAKLNNRFGAESILGTVTLGLFAVIFYWAMVGISRYFTPRD